MSDLRMLALASGALDDLHKAAGVKGFLGQLAGIPGKVVGTGIEQTGKLIKDHPGTALSLAGAGMAAKAMKKKHEAAGMTGSAFTPANLNMSAGY